MPYFLSIISAVLAMKAKAENKSKSAKKNEKRKEAKNNPVKADTESPAKEIRQAEFLFCRQTC